MEKIRRAAELLYFSKSAVALTGAGVSTESGIPDFRSPKSLLWERIHAYQFMPMEAYTDGKFDYIEMFYRFWFPLLFPMMESRPNVNHYFLNDMEKRGLLTGVITQNTDGLHRKAGSEKIFEVHGNLEGGHCFACGEGCGMERIVSEIESLNIPPRCPKCGGILGPNIVFAFERTEDYDQGLKLAGGADLLLTMGSSLLVDHVKEIVMKCLGGGGRLVVINAQPTPFDDVAEVVIRERLSLVIGPLWDTIESYF
jgi:NAD-dependent deacetylase